MDFFFFVVFNLRNSLMFLDLHKGRGRVQLQMYRGSSGLGPGGTTPVQIDYNIDMWGSKQAILDRTI